MFIMTNNGWQKLIPDASAISDASPMLKLGYVSRTYEGRYSEMALSCVHRSTIIFVN